MRLAMEDRATVVMPRLTASGTPAFRPPLLGPLLRALLAAVVIAAVVGMAVPGPVGIAAGAGLTMAFVGVALYRVIRSADRGY